MQSDGPVHETLPRRLSDEESGELGLATFVQPVPSQCSVNVFAVTPAAEAVTELPTAIQLSADEHETPASEFSAAPPAFGVGTIDQLVPFQRSARLFCEVDVEENPTAAQSLALAHDTPLSCVSFEPVGFGAATIAHWVPFHRSINTFVSEPDVLVAEPTAKRSVVIGHDTLLREASEVPAGPDVETTTHLVPFQRSASVASSDVPTALQSAALGHDTPTSWLCDVCEMSGAIDQLLPFQRSTDAEFPTAAQLTGLEHDTPVRPADPSRTPIGPNAAGSAGLATIDHRDPFHCSTSCLAFSPFASVA